MQIDSLSVPNLIYLKVGNNSMNSKRQILRFIRENSEEKISEYYQKLFDKNKDLAQRINKVSLYLILCVAVFSLCKNSSKISFSLGPLNLSDVSIIFKLLPIVYSYFLLEYAVAMNNKSEVFRTLKWILLFQYKQNIKDEDYKGILLSFFSRIIIPFSLWLELKKVMSVKGLAGDINLILIFPFWSLLFIPFYFQYSIYEYLIINYWDTWSGKTSLFLSIWLTLITIYFVLRVIIAKDFDYDD